MGGRKLRELTRYEKALLFAVKAHDGQYDKAGEPYILHPLQVSFAVEGDDAKILALLHDVVEDTSITLDDVEKENFGFRMRHALDCLTRREGETYKNFIARVMTNSLAVRVKIADMKHNLSRINNLPPKEQDITDRYNKWLPVLEERMTGRITFPSDTTKITYKELKGVYDDIKTIVISPQVTEIDVSGWGFGLLQLDNLERIEVAEKNPYFTAVDGVLYNKDMTTLLFYPQKKSDEAFIIPDNVTTIGERSFDLDGWHFDGEPGLGEVTFPAGLKRIEPYAFFKYNMITRFHIPADVEHIGYLAFFGCSSHLTEILVDEKNARYCSENGVLYNKAKTAIFKVPPGAGHKTFEIPPTVRAIAACAFRSCTELEEITIPQGVTVIGRGAFEECGIKRIVLPGGLKIIDALAFASCYYLEKINIPNGATKLGGYAFNQCENLRTVHLPDSIKHMGVNFGERPSAVFFHCRELYSFTFSAHITKIASLELAGSKINGHLTLPAGVTNIGFMAFHHCKELEGVTIPVGVTKIEKEAFLECPKLTIHCVEDSVAHKYAMENNIPFHLESVHT
jgi:hypothetical protein